MSYITTDCLMMPAHNNPFCTAHYRDNSVNMAPKEKYSIEDFENHAGKLFPDTYAIVANPGAYRFHRKTYVNAAQQPYQAEMLRVGSFHKRAGGPSVWAFGTAEGVSYFWGSHAGEMWTLISDEHRVRIYFDGPYLAMSGI